jgi:hypothetical protein
MDDSRCSTYNVRVFFVQVSKNKLWHDALLSSVSAKWRGGCREKPSPGQEVSLRI